MTPTTSNGFAYFTIVKGKFTKARIFRDGRLFEVQLHGKESYRQLLAQLNAGS